MQGLVSDFFCRFSRLSAFLVWMVWERGGQSELGCWVERGYRDVAGPFE
jgi:hypothetical protein